MPRASDVIKAFDAMTGDLNWSHRRNLPDDVYTFVGGNSPNMDEIDSVYAINAETGRTT